MQNRELPQSLQIAEDSPPKKVTVSKHDGYPAW